MKVSSPIGDLPFRLDHVRPGRDGITLTGRMGAWPARVTLDRHDAVDMVRATAPALGPLVVVGVLALGRRWIRR